MIGLVIITRRNRAIPLGSVFYRGALIGRVVRDSKIAAGTGGGRRSFYTAKAGIGPADPNGYNLGTRWVTREQAAAALLDFDRSHRNVAPYVAKAATRRGLSLYIIDRVNAWKIERRALFPFNDYSGAVPRPEPQGPQSAGELSVSAR